MPYDCDGVGAFGVKLTIDPSDPTVRPFYYQATTPSFTATATDGSGYGGGFLNVPVPPGSTDTIVTITATPGALGKPSSQAHVRVRAGTLTTVFMFPTQ